MFRAALITKTWGKSLFIHLFIVYLKTSSVTQDNMASNYGITCENLEMTRKKWPWRNFKYHPGTLRKATRKTTKNLNLRLQVHRLWSNTKHKCYIRYREVWSTLVRTTNCAGYPAGSHWDACSLGGMVQFADSREYRSNVRCSVAETTRHKRRVLITMHIP
jgi:hypothetical protein